MKLIQHLCTECVGHHEQTAVSIILPSRLYSARSRACETQEQLLEKYKKLIAQKSASN